MLLSKNQQGFPAKPKLIFVGPKYICRKTRKMIVLSPFPAHWGSVMAYTICSAFLHLIAHQVPTALLLSQAVLLKGFAPLQQQKDFSIYLVVH